MKLLKALLAELLIMQLPVALTLYTGNAAIGRVALVFLWCGCLLGFVLGPILIFAYLLSPKFRKGLDGHTKPILPRWYSIGSDLAIASACAYLGWVWTSALVLATIPLGMVMWGVLGTEVKEGE